MQRFLRMGIGFDNKNIIEITIAGVSNQVLIQCIAYVSTT